MVGRLPLCGWVVVKRVGAKGPLMRRGLAWGCRDPGGDRRLLLHHGALLPLQTPCLLHVLRLGCQLLAPALMSVRIPLQVIWFRLPILPLVAQLWRVLIHLLQAALLWTHLPLPWWAPLLRLVHPCQLLLGELDVTGVSALVPHRGPILIMRGNIEILNTPLSILMSMLLPV